MQWFPFFDLIRGYAQLPIMLGLWILLLVEMLVKGEEAFASWSDRGWPHYTEEVSLKS